MASLQQNLDVITSGQRIIAPADSGPSPLAGLAAVASAALGAGQAYQNMARQKKQEERQDILWDQQQSDRAEAQRGRDAADAIAKGAFDIFRTPSQADVPDEVKAGADKINKLQKGVAQGVVPAQSVDIQLENLVSTVMDKYPDQADEIMANLQARGIDHVLFRQRKFEAQRAVQEDQLQLLAEKTNYDYAVKNGYNPNTGSYEGAVLFGSKLRASEAQAEATIKQLDIQLKQAELAGKSTDLIKREKSQAIFQSISSDISTRGGYIVQSLGNFVAEAGNDPTKARELENLGPQINAFFTNYEASLIAKVTQAGGTPDDVKQVRDLVGGYKESAEKVFTGPLAQQQSNLRALEAMQTQFKIDAAKSLPLYNQLSTIFGKDTINQMFTTGVLTPEQTKAVADELAGFKVGSPDGQVALMNVGEVLRGNLNIRDLKTPEQRSLAMKTAKAAIDGNQKGAFQGLPDNMSEWANGYSVGLNAAVDLNASTATAADVAGAAKMFFGPEARTVIGRMKADPEMASRAAQIEMASRGAAVRVIRAADAPRISSKPDKYQLVNYNQAKGVYEVLFDNTRFMADWKKGKFDTYPNQGFVGGPLGTAITSVKTRPPAESLRAKMNVRDSELSAVANGLNSALDHLVQTKATDSQGLTGLTPAEQKAFFVNGTIPEGKAPKAATPAPTAADFEDRLSAFSGQLRDTTFDIVTNPDMEIQGSKIGTNEISGSLTQVARSSGYNLSPSAVAGIVGNLAHESGGAFNTSAINKGDGRDGSDSIGLAQWNSNRAAALKEFAAKRGTQWTDANTQLAFLVSEFKDHPGLIDRLNQAGSPEEAADIFAKEFLRPAGSNKAGFSSIHGRDSRQAAARKAAGIGNG